MAAVSSRDLAAAQAYLQARYAGQRHEVVAHWYREDRMTEPERPDPLAPLPSRAPRNSSPASQLTGVCATMRGERHCWHPVSVVLWIGCTKGEHAGPVEYCACCAVGKVTAVLACAQCLEATGVAERVRVLRITTEDGVTGAAAPGPAEGAEQAMRRVTGNG